MFLKRVKNAAKLRNLAILTLAATLFSGCVIKEPSYDRGRDAPHYHKDDSHRHHSGDAHHRRR